MEDLMYFMTSAFVIKNKFLLLLFFFFDTTIGIH